jgi:hypothetical protein
VRLAPHRSAQDSMLMCCRAGLAAPRWVTHACILQQPCNRPSDSKGPCRSSVLVDLSSRHGMPAAWHHRNQASLPELQIMHSASYWASQVLERAHVEREQEGGTPVCRSPSAGRGIRELCSFGSTL